MTHVTIRARRRHRARVSAAGWLLSATVALSPGCDPSPKDASAPSAADDDDDARPTRRSRPDADAPKPSRAAKQRSAMPLGKAIALHAPTEDGDAYRADHDAVVQVLALVAMGTLPVGEVKDGYRIEEVEAGSIFESAGLEKDDVVTHVNGVPILEEDVLRKAYDMLATLSGVVLTLRRHEKVVTLHYALGRTRGVRSRPSSEASSAGEPGRLAPEEVVRGVREVAPDRFEVSKKALALVLADTSALLRSVRILPSREAGKTNGLKLFGIRRGSLPDVFGFDNGDLLETVNGVDVADPASALAAYEALGSKPKTVVRLTRKGVTKRLEFVLVEP